VAARDASRHVVAVAVPDRVSLFDLAVVYEVFGGDHADIASPLQWLLQQRVRLAQDLLESTDQAIDEIARRAGFGTGASLRRHFVRVVGASPQAYRHAVRRQVAAVPGTGRG
jgi:hypothetical protein